MEDIASKIAEAFRKFDADALKAENGNKAAGRRARVLSITIAKMLLEFRKESIKSVTHG